MQKRCLLAVFLGTLVAGCASNKPSMESVQDLITGTWCEPDDAGQTCVGYMVYRPEGTYHAYGAFQEHDVAYESRGDWQADADGFCVNPRKRDFTRLSSGVPVYPETDLDPYCQSVEAIDQTAVVFSDPDGRETRMLRVSTEPDDTLEPGTAVPSH